MHATLTIIRRNSSYEFTLLSHASNLTNGQRSTLNQPGNSSRTASTLGNHFLSATKEIDDQKQIALQKQIAATVQTLNLISGAETVSSTGSAVKEFENLGKVLFTQAVPLVLQDAIRHLPDASLLEIITNDLNLPWEFLHDGQDFLALRLSVARLPILTQPPREHSRPAPRNKVSCLLLGNPTDDLPAAEKEIQTIEDILYSVRDRVHFKSFYGEAVTSLLLQEMLASQEYDLVHIACHAKPGALKLADGWFETDQFHNSLYNHPLIVLNACAVIQTAQASADFSSFSQNVQSLGTMLIEGGAAAVIGMLWHISDQATQQWSREFYQQLVMGSTVSAALRASRAEMYSHDSVSTSWLAPVLYGNPLHQPIPNALKKGAGTLLHLRFDGEMRDRRQSSRSEVSDRQRSLSIVCDRVSHYGGSIFYANSEGLLAAFGLYQSLDIDAIQAINAARDIRALAASWMVGMPAAAIASGEMFVTEQALSNTVIAPDQTPPLLFGKPVTDAHQLIQQALPGQIAVNQLARERCRERFHFRAWPSDRLLDSQTFAYELISTAVDVVTAHQTLNFDIDIGHEHEQQMLARAWQATLGGQGQLIGISGEAGIGKSHLVNQFKTNHFKKGIEATDPQWIHVHCTAEMEHTPYSLLHRLFSTILELPEFATTEQIENLLARHFDEDNRADPALLLDLLSDQPQSLRLQEQAVYQHQLFTLLSTLLLKHLDQGPLTLVLEDAHWSDSATMAVLTHLANNIQEATILLLVIHRSQWQPPWNGKPHYQSINLKQFDATTSRRFLQSLLGSTELPKELLALSDHSSGNPLFLSEILVSLVEKGLLVAKDSVGSSIEQSPASETRWQLHGVLEPGELPDTVQRTIEMRLDQLDQEVRTVLQMAAVVGTSFTPEMLRWVLPDADNSLPTYLAKLVEHEFLRRRLGSQQYTFRHALIRDVTYARTPIARRQLWHRRLAEQLEQRKNPNRQALAELAQHYYFSLLESDSKGESADGAVILNRESDPAVVEKAIGYLLQSGQDALDRYGAREAATHFTRAKWVDGLRPRATPYQAQILSGLGHAYRMQSRFDSAIESYQEAHASFHRQPISIEIRPQIAEIARWLARLHMWRGEYEPALAWIETGLGHVQPYSKVECQIAVALLNIQAGSIYYNRGQNDQAEHSCRAGILLARSLGDENTIAEGNLVLGAVMRSIGKYEDALAYYVESMAIQEQKQNLYQINRLKMNIGVVHFSQADWQQASKYYSEAFSFWNEIDEKNLQAGIAINLGLIEHYQGNWDAARRHYQQALSSCQEIGNSKWLARVHNNLGTLYLQIDDLRNAKEQIAIGWGLLESYDIQDLRADVKSSQALLAIHEQEWDHAQQLVEEALSIATQSELALEKAVAMRILGQVYLGKQENEMALASLEGSRAILEELRDKYELARTHYQLALANETIGEKRQASQLCTIAIGAFQQLDAKYDLALANALQARLL